MCKRCACMYVRMCAYKLLREAWTKCRRCNTRTPPLTNPSSWTIECHYASIHRESSSSMISHKKKMYLSTQHAFGRLSAPSPLPRPSCEMHILQLKEKRGGRERCWQYFRSRIYFSQHTHTHTYIHCVANKFLVCVELLSTESPTHVNGQFHTNCGNSRCSYADRSKPKFTQRKSNIIIANYCSRPSW